MKNKFLLICFVILSFCLISCTNQFSGKKYSAELMGVEVIGLDFLDNSKVEIYFIGAEKQLAQYTFNKKTNIVKIKEPEIELVFNHSIATLNWTDGDTDFIFHQVEEINISNEAAFDFYPKAIIPSVDEYKSEKVVYSWYDSIGKVENTTKDGKTIVLEIAIGYKENDKVTATELESRKIEIQTFLKHFISENSYQDFSPLNEDNLRTEIKNGINDKVLTSARIRDIRITDIQ